MRTRRSTVTPRARRRRGKPHATFRRRLNQAQGPTPRNLERIRTAREADSSFRAAFTWASSSRACASCRLASVSSRRVSASCRPVSERMSAPRTGSARGAGARRVGGDRDQIDRGFEAGLGDDALEIPVERGERLRAENGGVERHEQRTVTDPLPQHQARSEMAADQASEFVPVELPDVERVAVAGDLGVGPPVGGRDHEDPPRFQDPS